MKTLRVVSIMTALALIAGMIVSCACPTPTPEATKEPMVIVIGTTDKPAVLDPADCYGFPGWEFTHQIADGLLNNVPGTSGDLELGLAADWPTISDDGLEYTFKLREGVTFPDGTPFNADAVVFSIQDRVIEMEKTLAGEVAFLVSAYIDHVEKVDDYTVKFVLPAPVGFFPQLVATNPYKIVNPNTWSTEEYQPDNYSGGIGRYVCTSWKRDEEAIFERNETYYGTPAVADKVIVRYFADAAAMALALENGEIDVAWKTLLPADLERLDADPDIVLEQGPGTEIRYVCYQCQTEPFNDARVRQALGLCLDRAQIADVGFQGTKVPLYSMVPPGFLGHKVFYPEEPDLEQAKTLLADAGFDESNPLVMDLWWTPDHYGDTEADVAAIIKDNYEATGVIQVNLQNAEWATYKEMRNAGQLPVYLLGWYPDYLDSDNYTFPFAHSSATKGIGTYYSNPDMDALLEQAMVETDDAARAALYEQIQEMWFEENPTTPFAQGALYAAYAEGVTGVTLDPLMQLHYFLIGK
jgi:peptide/nickel transport system substrate-binding protein